MTDQNTLQETLEDLFNSRTEWTYLHLHLIDCRRMNTKFALASAADVC